MFTLLHSKSWAWLSKPTIRVHYWYVYTNLYSLRGQICILGIGCTLLARRGPVKQCQNTTAPHTP